MVSEFGGSRFVGFRSSTQPTVLNSGGSKVGGLSINRPVCTVLERSRIQVYGSVDKSHTAYFAYLVKGGIHCALLNGKSVGWVKPSACNSFCWVR